MSGPAPVLLLVRELDLGGCERDLTKVALRLDRSRFEPHVACFRPDGVRRNELDAAGVPVLQLPVTSFGSFSVFQGAATLRRYLRRHHIRLVHAFDVPTSAFTPPWARLFGVPAVITSQLSYRALAPGHLRAGLRLSDRLSHRIVVNCKAMWRHMADDEGVPERKLFLCYNGVETAVFHPGERMLPPSLAGAPLVIGCIAGLRPEKRLDLLIQAFARVAGLAPGVKLLIVGSGSELPVLQNLARQLKVDADTVFEPATHDVPRWLHAIDIFVLASGSEAFSNALLEAMASGCCPVGSNIGGTPELIAHGERGLLFSPGDASALADQLASLIQSPAALTRMAGSAATHARTRLSMDLAIERISGLYSDLLSGAERMTTGKGR